MPKHYDIPGFSQYEVRQPFTIWNRTTGQAVTISRDARRAVAHLWDDSGKRRTLSIIRIAALAYHGQAPVAEPHLAHHYGGPFNPTTVVWLPQKRQMAMRRSRLTVAQMLEVQERWLAGETQQALADEYGVSQVTIHRIVNGDNAALPRSRFESGG